MSIKSLKNKLNRLRNNYKKQHGFKNAKERRKAIKSLQNIDPDIQASDIQSPEDAENLWGEYIPNYFSDQPLTEKNAKFDQVYG